MKYSEAELRMSEQRDYGEIDYFDVIHVLKEIFDDFDKELRQAYIDGHNDCYNQLKGRYDGSAR